MNKPLEYWAVLAGMVIYAATRDAEKAPLMRRITRTLASALLSYGLTPSLAPWTYDSELFAMVLIMCIGMILLDVATEIFSNPEFVKEIIRSRIGGTKKDE